MVKTKRNLLLVILSVIFALTLISFVAAKPVNAEASVITLKETASVRIDKDGKNGIRFTGYVSRDVELDEDTFAGIIVAKGDVEAPVVTDDVIDVKAERFDEANDTEAGRAFNAVIWDIPLVAYAQDLTARAYICDNGVYTYSDNVLTRSLAQVASSVLVNDEPTIEDAEILKGYVDGANPVLSVNGVAFAEDVYEMDLEVITGDVITLDCTPANLAAEIILSSDALSIEYDGILAKKASAGETATIILGSKEYTINVSIEKFVDTNKFDSVLADFDELGYSDYLSADTENGGAISVLTSGAEYEAIGATSGVAFANGCSYDVFRIDFHAPIKFNDVKEFYLMVYAPVTAVGSDFRLRFYGESGTLGSLINFPVDAGAWKYVTISGAELAANFGGDVDVFAMQFYTIDKDCYIDQIGYVPNGAFVDTDMEEGMIADFDEMGYANNIISNCDYGGYFTMVPGSLAGLESEAVLYGNCCSYDRVNVIVPEPFSMNEVELGLVIRMKFSGAISNFRIYLYDAEGNSISAADGASRYFDAISDGYKNDGQWQEIRFPIEKFKQLSADLDAKIGQIQIHSGASAGTMYIDEVRFQLPWTDTNIEENVLADFDEFEYIEQVSYRGYSNVTFSMVEGSEAGLDSDAVLKVNITSASSDNIEIDLFNTFKISELEKGIYIRVKESNPSAIGGMRLYLYDAENNGLATNGGQRYFSAIASYTETTDWQTITFSADSLKGLFTDVDTEVTRLTINIATTGTLYIDEIGILA